MTVRPIHFHRRLDGYRATRLASLQPPGGPNIRRMLMKLETARFGLPSFKGLGASWGSARRTAAWLDSGANFDGSLHDLRERLAHERRTPRLVAATDGNHGRAVAWTARQMGLGADIFVPRGTAPARISAIEEEGARVTVVAGDYDATVATAAATAGAGRLLIQDTAVAGHEAVVEDIVAGYSTIFDELDEQLGRGDDRLVLVVPVGVGSLAVAAARYLRARPQPSSLVTVEPVEAASLARSTAEGRLVSMPGPHTSAMVGLRCGSISASAWPELSASVSAAVAVEDGEADEAMRFLAASRIEVGECGAATLAAVNQLGASGGLDALVGDAPATIALIATEGPTDPARWESVVGRPPASVA